jgi:hypothetical protein
MHDQRQGNNGPAKQKAEGQARLVSAYAMSDADELVRDWQLLFWVFSFSAVVQLGWICLWPPRNVVFHLGSAAAYCLQACSD